VQFTTLTTVMETLLENVLLELKIHSISSSVPDNPGKINQSWSVIDLDVSNICDYYVKITLSACILKTD